MSNIDELKARAERLGLPFRIAELGTMLDGLYLTNSDINTCLVVAEHAARIAAERVRKSARVCVGCHGYGYLRMAGLQNSAGNCEKCHGTGIRFEEDGKC